MLHTTGQPIKRECVAMAHIRGHLRTQTTLFPEALDDLIDAQAQVRVIDAFVASLDLASLGFGKAITAATGRPYDPADLLKLYVYGYLNQVRSSRRLEREAGRNMELMWMLNRLCSDFKTIADFRKDNVGAIVGACRAFTWFCREQGLFGAELVAIDGSKFQAVASRKQVWTAERIERVQGGGIDRRIGEYLARLDQADVGEPTHRVSIRKRPCRRLSSSASGSSPGGAVRGRLAACGERARCQAHAHSQSRLSSGLQRADGDRCPTFADRRL